MRLACSRTQVSVAIALIAAIVSCTKAPVQPPAPPPPRVVAIPVIQRTATVTGEQVGEVRAYREVDLRPQVTGTVQTILFEPGQAVKQGQVLFIIDPRPYEANLAQALAEVADAEAALARAQQDVARYEPLLPDNAIPRATYDAALAAVKSARAAVDARRAVADKARLDVENTRVRSPVTGQIGLQKIEVGALASAGQTVLATVSTLDPVYVNFSIPESDYVRFVRAGGSRAGAVKEARSHPIEIILPDGSLYPLKGRFDFAERAITTATGTLLIRALFPNPQKLLRPGLNVRVRTVYEEIPNALLVPQRAVIELLGKTFVMVIAPGDKTEQRPVELGDRTGEFWIVKAGLTPGERIVVDGLQKAPPGTRVIPTVITEAQLDHPPPLAPPSAAASPAPPPK
jgi:membrane fusion protein (multidrug efflux system)